MNLALLSAALETRITSDTGSGGLMNASAPLINAVFFDVVLGGASPPYIVITFPGTDEDDTFPTDATIVYIEFEVVMPRRLGTFSTDSNVLKRMLGVFHRWTPTTTGYSTQALKRTGGTTAHDEEYRRYIERYETRMDLGSKAADTIGPA